jgi:hypothetical protein
MLTPQTVVEQSNDDLKQIAKLTAKKLKPALEPAPELELSQDAPSIAATIVPKQSAFVQQVNSVDWDSLTPDLHPHPLIRQQQIQQYYGSRR